MPRGKKRGQPEENEKKNASVHKNKRVRGNNDDKINAENDAEDILNEVNLGKLSFRNYRPNRKKLQARLKAPIDIADELLWLDEWLKGIMTSNAAERAEIEIAPRPPNWDLKRQVADRLTLLDVKTREAIRALVQDKIGKEEA